MALKAASLGETFEFVSNDDPAKVSHEVPLDPNDPSKGTKIEYRIGEDATIFHLQTLDVFLMGHIYDRAQTVVGTPGSNEIGIVTKVNQTNIDAVRFALRRFDNFTDDRGHPVSVNTQSENVGGRTYLAADDKTMQRLSIQLIQEMAEEVKRRSEVSKQQAKN